MWIQYCVDGTGDVIRIQYESKTYLTWIWNSWSYFGRVEQNLSRQKLGYILSTFQRPGREGILWKQSPRGTPRIFFPLYNGVAPPVYVPTASFKLMSLRNIMVGEALLSKSASVTMKQTSNPVQSKKVKRRKLNNVIMHCEKSSTSQIGFYSIRSKAHTV